MWRKRHTDAVFEYLTGFLKEIMFVVRMSELFLVKKGEIEGSIHFLNYTKLT